MSNGAKLWALRQRCGAGNSSLSSGFRAVSLRFRSRCLRRSDLPSRTSASRRWKRRVLPVSAWTRVVSLPSRVRMGIVRTNGSIPIVDKGRPRGGQDGCCGRAAIHYLKLAAVPEAHFFGERTEAHGPALIEPDTRVDSLDRRQTTAASPPAPRGDVVEVVQCVHTGRRRGAIDETHQVGVRPSICSGEELRRQSSDHAWPKPRRTIMSGAGSPAGMFQVKRLECWVTRWRMAAIRELAGDHERVLENGDPALKSEHTDRPRANAGSVASRIARPSGGASSLGGHCQTAPPPAPREIPPRPLPHPAPGLRVHMSVMRLFHVKHAPTGVAAPMSFRSCLAFQVPRAHEPHPDLPTIRCHSVRPSFPVTG